MKDEFKPIDGTVLLSCEGEAPVLSPLFMFGDMNFLFVNLPYREMLSHLSEDGVLGMDSNWKWSNLKLGEAFRRDTSGSVVSAFDIARETAKRLGVFS